MQPPLVSVIIPAFNASATLARTLATVAAQTYRELEIIIVDDGSSDDTGRLAREFCSKDPRGLYVRQANAGVAVARNTGIETARGEWLAPLDADDLWHPTKIQSQVDVALSAPRPPGFVYCWFHLIDEEDQVIGSSEAYRVRGSVVDPMLNFNFVGNGSSLLIKRDAAVSVQGYDKRLSRNGFGGCEDLFFQLRVAANHPVEIVPQYLVGYRCAEGSMSEDWERMHRSWERVLELFAAEVGELNSKCVRRNAAYRALRAAEKLVKTGRKGDATRQIIRAIRLDPPRSSAKLFHRFARSARRRVWGARPRPETVSFFNAPIDSPVKVDPDEIAWLAQELSSWDQRRMSVLAGADFEPAPAISNPGRRH